MNNNFEITRNIANGVILTALGPAERNELNKFIKAFDKLQQELNAARTEIAHLNKRIEAAWSAKDAETKQLAEVQEKLEQAQDKIESLETEIYELQMGEDL